MSATDSHPRADAHPHRTDLRWNVDLVPSPEGMELFPVLEEMVKREGGSFDHQLDEHEGVGFVASFSRDTREEMLKIKGVLHVNPEGL